MDSYQWTEYLRGRAEGCRPKTFDPSDLAPQFVPYFNERKTRIEVETTFADGTTHRRTGYVGITTGWKPAFLLMHASNHHGSSDVLSVNDKVLRAYSVRRRRGL